jgi:hypothetical protein
VDLSSGHSRHDRDEYKQLHGTISKSGKRIRGLCRVVGLTLASGYFGFGTCAARLGVPRTFLVVTHLALRKEPTVL